MPAGFYPSTTHLLKWLCSAGWSWDSPCIAKPASFMLQASVFSPGSKKVTAGCFSSCGLWAMWSTHFSPSHCSAAAPAVACQTETCQSQGCWLASLLSTCWSLHPPVWNKAQRPPQKEDAPLTLTVKLSSTLAFTGLVKRLNTGQIKWDEMSHYPSSVSMSCNPPVENSTFWTISPFFVASPPPQSVLGCLIIPPNAPATT